MEPGSSKGGGRAGLSLIALTALLGGLLTGCAKAPAVVSETPIPDFVLTDQNGSPFHSDMVLKGHVWVADFMFTNCPGPCPRMSSQMRDVQTALHGKDVRLISYTIDPARDTPEMLARYASNYHATPGVWYFLTGPLDTLRMLDRDAFKLGDIDGSYEHSTRFVLLDRKSRIRGYYLTSEEDAIPKLIKDASAVLRESL
jgi:protein SCO1/2